MSPIPGSLATAIGSTGSARSAPAGLWNAPPSCRPAAASSNRIHPDDMLHRQMALAAHFDGRGSRSTANTGCATLMACLRLGT